MRTVFAQVTENVRGSATGRTVLIPQRIILPDGSSLSLANTPAADLSGYSGVEDRVDVHTWRLLKGLALSIVLGGKGQHLQRRE